MNPGDPRRPSAQTSFQQAMAEAAPYLGLGLQLAATMAFFTVGGYFLDGWLDLSPWLTVAGAVLGMTGVFAQLFRINTEANAAQKKRRGETRKKPRA